jgi:hypothetical protein
MTTVYSISEQDAEEVMGETPGVQYYSRPASLSGFCDFSDIIRIVLPFIALSNSACVLPLME